MADIFVPGQSRGLVTDGLLLGKILGNENSNIINYPDSICGNPLALNDKTVKLTRRSNTAIFVERLFELSTLSEYKNRVFIANPEWLAKEDLKIARSIVSEFWHKTQFSLNILSKIFPGKTHRYIGFSSLCEPGEVVSHEKICHFSGKSQTRHTQDLIDIWIANPDFPVLTLQSYGGVVSIPWWINTHNLRLMLGFLDEKEYETAIADHGIHICTSQMEGFGHYINEARSLGALVIVIDAPPMNELIDSSCGVLIPYSEAIPHNCGIRYIATPAAIKTAITEVFQIPMSVRKDLGEKARMRFLKDRDDFIANLRAAYSELESPG